tara:strand:+ start:353 stop:475 length:123 start_codon:yes stop_codon:yes gene_type:complete
MRSRNNKRDVVACYCSCSRGDYDDDDDDDYYYYNDDEQDC